MRFARILIPAASLAVIALALTTPAQAADLKPRGGALVSVTGGTAKAKPIGNDRYMLMFPEGADITWFGEAKGMGSAPVVGRFTPRQVTKGWTALGHRKGVGVAASLVWQQEGGDTSVVVLASDPQVRADGSLALKVFTQEALPLDLPGYLITVTRAPKTSRGFPVSGPGTWVSGNAYVSTTAKSASSSSGKIYSGAQPSCLPYDHSASVNAKVYFIEVKCGKVTFSNRSYVVITQAAPGQCGSDLFSLTVVTSSDSTTLAVTDLTWDVNGKAIPAGVACS